MLKWQRALPCCLRYPLPLENGRRYCGDRSRRATRFVRRRWQRRAGRTSHSTIGSAFSGSATATLDRRVRRISFFESIDIRRDIAGGRRNSRQGLRALDRGTDCAAGYGPPAAVRERDGLIATQRGSRRGAESAARCLVSTALNSPDQLRQRVAFALSQIFVVSERGPLEYIRGHSPVITTCSFERALAISERCSKQVTLHPAMGVYSRRSEIKSPTRLRRFVPTRTMRASCSSCSRSGSWSSTRMALCAPMHAVCRSRHTTSEPSKVLRMFSPDGAGPTTRAFPMLDRHREIRCGRCRSMASSTMSGRKKYWHIPVRRSPSCQRARRRSRT